ncbi:MAG TPA: SUMF1/EgtB/PvdO family nonheme iron enzyme, partial [bacterium]|nr:SUMF1/EgtB/PvdO family nonheme iron enzyme [bacterium]
PNGVFTRVFLKEMDKPNVPVREVLQHVRDTVIELAQSVGKDQFPALYDQARGDFYFRQVASVVPVPVQAPSPAAAVEPQRVQTPEEREAELWERIKDSRDMSEFEDFLRRYPTGRFTVWARASLNKLRDANENEAWEAAKRADRREDYDNYLQLYPRGRNVEEARERLRQRMIQDEREAWEAADRDGTEPAYRNYLDDYPSGPHVAAAKDRLNKLKLAGESIDWENAKRNNRKQDYDDYLEQYPKGKYVEQARAALKKLASQEGEQREKDAWDTARGEDTDASYQKYLAEFPKGRYVQQARNALAKLRTQSVEQREKDAWDAAEADGTEAAIRKYLADYPRGRYVPQARNRLTQLASGEAQREREAWEAAERDGSEPAYARYLDAYAAGPHAAAARARRDTWAQWRRVEASQDAGEVQAFIDRNRDAPPAILALALVRIRTLQEQDAARVHQDTWARAAAGDIAAVQDYLDRYPNGPNVAAARERLTKLKEEQALREEHNAWRNAAASTDMAVVQDYLDRYPNGANVSAAKERLRKMRIEAAAREEQDAWKKAEASRDAATIQEFIARYPSGVYVGPARSLLGQLKAEGAVREELDAWARAENAVDLDVVRGYLARYPGGPHAELARQRLKDMPTVIAGLDEDGAWNKAKNSDDPAATEAYLSRFPRGRYVVEAMERLANILRRKMPQPPGTVLLDPFIDGSALGPELVVVASGVFEMGDAEGNEPEKPVHRVIVTRPFAIGKYEITFDDWDACYADKGCEHNPSDEGPFMFNVKGRGKNPVINVSWDDVHQYMKWMGTKTGRRYRLPTEAEWEFAARGGTYTRYSFGNDVNQLPKYGWSLGESKRMTHPVGQLAPNPFGIFDMHGNVSEWVQDCMHTSYAGAPLDGSTAWTTDCIGDAVRVVRGGSALDASGNLRSASRTRFAQKTRNFTVGFRVASDYP